MSNDSIEKIVVEFMRFRHKFVYGGKPSKYEEDTNDRLAKDFIRDRSRNAEVTN